VLKALVLAAGKGERLLPITEHCPKVLVPLVGRPLIDYLMDDLAQLRLDEIVVVLGHRSDLVKNHLGDGSRYGTKVSYVHQKRLTGEAEALLVAEELLSGENSFLVVDGDFVAGSGLVEKTMNVGLSKDADITVALTQVSDPSQYGVVKLGKDDRLLDIIEKPPRAKAPSNLAVSSAYLFKPSIFDGLHKIHHLERAMAMMMKSGAKGYGAIWDGEWIDIGRPWDLLRGNQFLIQRMFAKEPGHKDATAQIAASAILEVPFYIGPHARIMDNARVAKAYIDEDGTVGTNSLVRDYSYVGRKSVVGFASEVKSSIVMDETNIGHLAYVGDSIVGRKCELGAGAITANTRFDQGTISMYIGSQKIDSGRTRLGAVIGDGAQIGVNVSIYPGRKIGSGVWVPPGTVVLRNLPNHKPRKA
jgi:bifunctional UDP-N-acetylglucosamine pyrophosphorylase/glucosamine-1-phosphate N-acetyltransferase